MKKTLSIALVAAMTLSAIGMTAFAETKYNGGGEGDKIDKLSATIKIADAKEFTKMDLDGDGKVTAEEALDYSYSNLNTPTKTFKTWAATSGAASATAAKPVTPGQTVSDAERLKKDATIATSGSKFPVEVKTWAIYTYTTDDNAIKENMKNLGNKDTSLEDKLAELDKQYNADGKNAYDADKTDVEGRVTVKRYTKDETKNNLAGDMDDFFTHAAEVAGVSKSKDDDGVKTWVFDVKMVNGEKLYAGKNQRVCLTLAGVSEDADLNKFGVSVYHIKGWCSAEKIKKVYTKGNKVYFWNDEFSPYVVSLGDGVASTGAADASNPSTGDFSAVPVALLAAAALGATGFVAYKKRKAE
ncbi:MAG: LPXTG cell wall anchor domain-containing protein [Clostridia bacterium]|nr:LPXTG cell wall anchor domain-containing protein [Clostridia bacterium]